ncbi:GH39 family glycosyl hydrolase [Algibacillus agarilyticus]|uniref:GH39 family glycosyl hydrolase n=1 Tax=Algibacillus agarilyticus TaxID=2234133 RepID=UPI000DD0E625|nr:hypothetical protein [Algibacillus agarilyticus]
MGILKQLRGAGCRPIKTATMLSILSTLVLTSNVTNATVKITTDMTNSDNKKGKIHNYWNVRNEIPPYPNLTNVEVDRQDSMNLIRLLGGEAKSGQKVTDNDAIIYKNGEYVFRYWKVRSRIDAVKSHGYKIHQIVLDNPPWAMQRGLNFVENPTREGEYDIDDKISTYGNSFPPGEPAVWADFIEKLIGNLIQKYGVEEVSSWRFRVHTEADFIPHHWSGTKKDYFDHYKNTVRAVRRALPSAKVGSHFLPPPSGSNRYGVEFVGWTSEQNLPLNDVGLSYYPFYNNSAHVDMDRVWEKFVKPFKTSSGWKAGTSFSIPEFTLFTERDDDGYNVPVGSAHRDAFYAMMSKMVFEKGINKVHTWGDKTNNPFFLAIKTMAGKDRYKNWRSGTPLQSGNMVDGYFAASTDKKKIDAIVFNYNADPLYKADDKIEIAVTVPYPPGTRFNFRSAIKRRANNAQHQFAQQYVNADKYVSDGGWVLDKVRPDATTKTDKNGDYGTILTTWGKNKWKEEKENLSGYQSLNFSSNTTVHSVAIGSNQTKSQIKVQVSMPSFSFRKVEFRKQ